MNIVFRVDSSFILGSGHLMRCITLADLLQNQGCDISFICRNLPGNLNSIPKEKGYSVYSIFDIDEELNWERDVLKTITILNEIDKKIDWVIVDHYYLDKKWENKLRTLGINIMAIDDLANRPHDCDVLLDQNYYQNMEFRYKGLVPISCKKFFGPQYALLRPEFEEAYKTVQSRDGLINRILLFFGGSDPTNETLKALKAIKKLNYDSLQIIVVVGANNSNQDEIKKFCVNLKGVIFYCQVNNMARLIANSDLAIGAGGTTTWERCFLGLPTLTIIVAQNQAETTIAVAKYGAIWNLGFSESLTEFHIADALKKALTNQTTIREMSQKAFELMGNGRNLVKTILVRSILEKAYL